MKLNRKLIANFLGILMIINGFFMICCIIPGLIYADGGWKALLLSGIVAISIGVLLFAYGKEYEKNLGKREGYLIVTLGWVLMALTGCLPFLYSGVMTTFSDAFFETISGYTTTGATVLTDIETVPPSILMWRSVTHWLGGMGIIVLTLAVLPILGIGGMQLFSAEAPGVQADKLHPRITGTAKRLWIIYVGMTIIEIVLLLLGDMSWFDAITHAFSTVSTGGFSTKNESIAHFQSPYIHYVIIFFMFLSGINFSLTYFTLKGQLRKIWKDQEFRFYITLILLLTTIVTVVVFLNNYGDPQTTFRNALFQVVAVITTTGFVTDDFTAWTPSITVLFFLMMFLGGSAGSTAGGIKLVRHLVIIKNSIMELKRLLHPAAVIPVKYNTRSVKGRITFNIMAFMIIYFFIFAIGALVIGLTGQDFSTSIGASASCLGNVGPGLGHVGPVENYASISSFGKIFLSLLMLIGRLEIFTVLIILTPYFWRRY